MGNNKKLTQVRDNVCIGMRSYGWICKKEYTRFYLWEKATRSGKIIRECFYKQELMNDLIDSYLLLNNDEYNSLDKKIAYMLELLNIINEYVQLPVKSYCKELPKDMTEIEKIVKAKSRYHLAIMNKINTASLPTR